MLKVVLDTNIFVSSLLSKAGRPAMVIDSWRAGNYLLVISHPIISEIKRVVEAPNFFPFLGQSFSGIRLLG